MFVYGVPCTPEELLRADIPENLTADYYADWQILVFPTHTRPPTIRSHSGQLGPTFWHEVRLLVENPQQPRRIEHEHPWLSDQESAVVESVGRQAAWFYLPYLTALKRGSSPGTAAAAISCCS